MGIAGVNVKIFKIGLDDFCTICGIGRYNILTPWLIVASDGVYLNIDFATKYYGSTMQLGIMCKNKEKDLFKPLLKFPSSQAAFFRFLVEQELDDDDIKQNMRDMKKEFYRLQRS